MVVLSNQQHIQLRLPIYLVFQELLLVNFGPPNKQFYPHPTNIGLINNLDLSITLVFLTTVSSIFCFTLQEIINISEKKESCSISLPYLPLDN